MLAELIFGVTMPDQPPRRY